MAKGWPIVKCFYWPLLYFGVSMGFGGNCTQARYTTMDVLCTRAPALPSCNTGMVLVSVLALPYR